MTNAEYIKKELKELGFLSDMDVLTELCPPQYNWLFCSEAWCNNPDCVSCEECRRWWYEEYKEE